MASCCDGHKLSAPMPRSGLRPVDVRKIQRLKASALGQGRRPVVDPVSATIGVMGLFTCAPLFGSAGNVARLGFLMLLLRALSVRNAVRTIPTPALVSYQSARHN